MADSQSLISLVYLSEAVIPFSAEDLIKFLTRTREANATLGVTGMLLFKARNFLQVLEGERDTVLALYKKIGKDPRHRALTTLSQTIITKRDFPDWSMGFHDLGSADLPNLPGFSAFLDTTLTAADFAADPGRGKKLLLLFKEEKLLAKTAVSR